MIADGVERRHDGIGQSVIVDELAAATAEPFQVGSMALMTEASFASTLSMSRSKSKSHQFQSGLSKAQCRQKFTRAGTV